MQNGPRMLVAIALGALIATFPLVVSAQDVSPRPTSTPSGAFMGARVSENEAALDATAVGGPHFRAGDTIVMSEAIVGDLYVAGGTVRIEGEVDGDLLIAGGQVTINGPVTKDLRVVGGSVTVRSEIGDDVSAVGGNIIFAPTSTVSGSIVVAGGSVSLEGAVTQETWLAAGMAELVGQFGQDVRVAVGALSFLPGSVIEGSLLATVDKEGHVVDRGEVRGERHISRVTPEWGEQERRSQQAATAGTLAAVGVVQMMLGLLMGVIGGAVLYYLFPRFTARAVARLAEQPLPSFGWGLLSLVVAPILVILAWVSVLGVPLGFLLLFMHLVAMLIAFWIAGIWVGQLIFGRTQWGWLESPYVQLFTGLLVFQLIGLTPVIGWVVKFVLFAMGLGAVVRWFLSSMSTSPEQTKPVTRSKKK